MTAGFAMTPLQIRSGILVMDMPDFFRKVCIRARTGEYCRNLGIKWQEFKELDGGAAAVPRHHGKHQGRAGVGARPLAIPAAERNCRLQRTPRAGTLRLRLHFAQLRRGGIRSGCAARVGQVGFHVVGPGEAA